MAGAVQIASEHITVLGSAVGGDYAAELAVDADGGILVSQPQASPWQHVHAERASFPGVLLPWLKASLRLPESNQHGR